MKLQYLTAVIAFSPLWLNANAQVDPRAHEQCVNARDYQGCLTAHQKARSAHPPMAGVTKSANPVVVFDLNDPRSVKESKCAKYMSNNFPHFGTPEIACQYFAEKFTTEFCNGDSHCLEVWGNPLAVVQMSMRYAGEYYANQRSLPAPVSEDKQAPSNAPARSSSLADAILLDAILNKPKTCYGFGSAYASPIGSSVGVTGMSSTQCF